MGKQFFIANWKSHKTSQEAHTWLEDFRLHLSQIVVQDKSIILCPPFPLLPVCFDFLQKHPMSVALGSQTVSSYPEGIYTGEVSARLLKDFVSYTLIGHSERRRLFHETEEDIVEKIRMVLSCQIVPILLISDKNAVIPKGVDMVIYEPPSAISSASGTHPDNPEDVEAAARFLKQKNSVLYVLYGGSVTPENVHEFCQLSSIDGVIVGGESLNPLSFAHIIEHA